MSHRIYIPTYRRSSNQRTYEYLPPTMQALVIFVADDVDAERLRRRYFRTPLTILSPDVATIAQKRAWIIRNASEDRILMLDDDLEFVQRTETPGEKAKTRMCAPAEIEAAIQGVFEKLGEFAHVGISARQGNNTMERGWHLNTRMMFALGYQPEALRQNCELGRIETREDMDYTLQLLRKGIPNAVTADVGTGHKKYDAPGGCSEQRTLEQSNADAVRLAQLHPGLVRVKERDFTFSAKRLEVTCLWKKAFAESQA